jgi:hypothetical protein
VGAKANVDEFMRQSLSRQITGLIEMRHQDDDEFAAALKELVAFRDERGWIPNWESREALEARLGSWLEAQRGAEKGGVLSSARRALLVDVLGPRWASQR